MSDGTEQNLKQTISVVGDKWSALILYYLHEHGPTRFIDCQKSQGVNPRTLASRLDSLEKGGFISKQLHSEYPPRSDYRLTPKGKSLIPVIQSMIDWAARN